MAQALREKPDIDDIRKAYNERSKSWSDHVMHLRRWSKNETRPVQSRHSSAPSTDMRQRSRQSTDATMPATISIHEHLQESLPASIKSTTSSIASFQPVEQQDVDFTAANDARPLQAIPATPSEFTALFPSKHEILIRHDDHSLDRNWNLRLDTFDTVSGTMLTLFHMRLQDIRAREFSLRRYCRDSGREVCRSTSRMQDSRIGRSALQRSISHAIQNVRARSSSFTRPSSARSTRRHSDCITTPSIFDTEVAPSHADGWRPQKTIRLEFSNYAQVNIARRSTGFNNRRYSFRYWGIHYLWKLDMSTMSKSSRIVLRLTRSGGDDDLARIRPLWLSDGEKQEERSRGGWVSPSSLCIEDQGIIEGSEALADVIVATGVVALVDHYIRRRIEVQPRYNVEFVGPRRFLQHFTKSRCQSRSDRLPHASTA